MEIYYYIKNKHIESNKNFKILFGFDEFFSLYITTALI